MGMVVQPGVMQRVTPLWKRNNNQPVPAFSAKLRTFEAYLCIDLARVHPPLLDQVPDDLQVTVVGREVQRRLALAISMPGICPCLLDQVPSDVQVAVQGSQVQGRVGSLDPVHGDLARGHEVLESREIP